MDDAGASAKKQSKSKHRSMLLEQPAFGRMCQRIGTEISPRITPKTKMFNEVRPNFHSVRSSVSFHGSLGNRLSKKSAISTLAYSHSSTNRRKRCATLPSSAISTKAIANSKTFYIYRLAVSQCQYHLTQTLKTLEDATKTIDAALRPKLHTNISQLGR